MEASALRHSASRLAGLSPRSTLLRLQGDDKLIALTRQGHEHAFEALVDRYQVRLLAFCRGMLSSTEDAEDVLQEVFVAAHAAMLRDSRSINARPWLYRIARNRCLNHLRKPVAEGVDSMDVMPAEHGASVAEHVQEREELRALISDVGDLAETQRTALLLREIDDLSYEEIAQAMDTTIPAVKSLLVRARMALADSATGRKLTCDEVRVSLAEAVEGLRKLVGGERAHLKTCEECRDFRAQLRADDKNLAALVPLGPLALFQHFFVSKLGIGGAKVSAGAGGASAAGGSGGAISIATGGGAAGLLGTKAVAGFASVALLTGAAVEAKHMVDKTHQGSGNSPATIASAAKPTYSSGVVASPKAHYSVGAVHKTATQAPDRSPSPAPDPPAKGPSHAPQTAGESHVTTPPASAEPTAATGSGQATDTVDTTDTSATPPATVGDTSGGSGTGTVTNTPPGTGTPIPTDPGDSDPVTPPVGTDPNPVDPTPVAPGASTTGPVVTPGAGTDPAE